MPSAVIVCLLLVLILLTVFQGTKRDTGDPETRQGRDLLLPCRLTLTALATDSSAMPSL